MMKLNAMELQGEIKEALGEWLPKEANKAVYAFCQKLATKVNRAMREWQREATEEAKVKAKVDANTLTDEERATKLTQFLDGKLMDGSLTAAELAQFKDIYGLKAKDRDVIVNIISWADYEHTATDG